MQKNYWIFFTIFLLTFVACTQEQIDNLLYTNKQPRIDKVRNDSLLIEQLCETLTNGLLDEDKTKMVSKNGLTNISDELIKVYLSKNFEQLRWQNTIGQTPKETISQYIDYLRKAEENGLTSENYKLSDIENRFKEVYPPAPKIDTTARANKDNKSNPPLPPPKDLQQMIDLDLVLSESYLNYASDLLYGNFRPKNRNWEVVQRERNLGEMLDKALNDNNIAASLQSLNPSPKNFVDFQKHFKNYLDISKKGIWKPIASATPFRKGKSSDEVLQLAGMLAAIGDLPADKANSNTFDNDFITAIKNYQTRNGLAITGAMDGATLKSLNMPIEERIALLKLNMNRYRWIPDNLGERYVWANIPEFMISVYDGDKRTTEIVSVVGEYKNMTPILIDRPMQNIIFSPTWTIPQSIAKEDLEFIKKNPGVLIVADVEVFLKGKKVNPYKVDWNKVNWKNVKMKQKPKDTNSMGRAKFMFTNNHSIYLHDTPNKVDFKSRVRSFSHGCIRVGDPALFAQHLLTGNDAWTNQKIRNAMFSEKERFVKPPKSTRVHLVYFTAWADDDGKLQFRRDIYYHDKRQLKSMNEVVEL